MDCTTPFGHVVFDQSFEAEADGSNVTFNTQRWNCVAANEADLVAAANQLLDTAVQQGWTLLDPYNDPLVSGIYIQSVPGLYIARLTKVQMVLTLGYTTTAFFAVLPDDVDELSLSADILLDPSRESRG